MLESYLDITTRINEEPKWHDSNGVPRYDKFHPNYCPDIYADEVILLKIACQGCGMKFLVEMHFNKLWAIIQGRKSESFSERIKKWNKQNRKEWPPIHYGDPPRHDCIGDTMNVYDLRIIEFWHRPRHEKDKNWERWKRDSQYEIELEKLERELREF